MVGYLVLQTTLQEQAFTLNTLRSESDELSARQSYLEAGLVARTTPLELAQAARSLGLVANPYGSFIDSTTGQVTGVTTVVRGDELPTLNTISTSQSQSVLAATALASAAPTSAAPSTAQPQEP